MPSVNNHTTTSQYSIQRQPSTKNSSIDSIVEHEYFEIILGKVLFNTATNRIEKPNLANHPQTYLSPTKPSQSFLTKIPTGEAQDIPCAARVAARSMRTHVYLYENTYT